MSEVLKQMARVQIGIEAYKAENTKHGWSGRGYSLDPFFLNLDRDGGASIGFNSTIARWERDDETGKEYVYCTTPASEVIALRDYLNAAFPTLHGFLPDGFTQEEFAEVEVLLTAGNEPVIKAALSNNFNVILAALRRASLERAEAPAGVVAEARRRYPQPAQFDGYPRDLENWTDGAIIKGLLAALDTRIRSVASAPAPAGVHICGCPEFGTYEGQVILASPDWLREKWPDGIGIDVCLALEIQGLWRQGIKTSGHCCGHGRAQAYISVWPESVEAMKALGYARCPHPDGRDDHFEPKTAPAPAGGVTEAMVEVACEAFEPVYGAGLSREGGGWKSNLRPALRAALSAALAKGAGWRSMNSAPRDGTRFVALKRWPAGYIEVKTYTWTADRGYWLALDNQTCIRLEYQDQYLWVPLPASPDQGQSSGGSNG